MIPYSAFVKIIPNIIGNELPRRKQRGITIENNQSYTAKRRGIIPNLLVRRSGTRRRIKNPRYDEGIWDLSSIKEEPGHYPDAFVMVL